MLDQATQLRQLVRDAVSTNASLAPGAPIVAVAGAQPGAGVTALVVRLAGELAQLGKQVAVVDANLRRPALAEAFALRESDSLADVLSGDRSAAEALVAVESNIRVLRGRPPDHSALLDHASLGRLAAELAAVGRQVDVMLIDVGGGMSPWVDRLWQLAAHVLLVIPPDAQALVAAYSAVKQSHHERLARRLRLVVNRCPQDALCNSLGRRFADTCQRFLSLELNQPTRIPEFTAPTPAPAPTAGDEPFCRAVRMLAADLACDFAAATRRPARVASQPTA